MIGRHLGRHLTEEFPQALAFDDARHADEVGLPADPEFRAAFVGYLEWGTRLAVMNSQDGVTQPPSDAPMPEWNWDRPAVRGKAAFRALPLCHRVAPGLEDVGGAALVSPSRIVMLGQEN